MTFILEIGQYFGTSQNGIEDKKNETEVVIPSGFFLWLFLLAKGKEKKNERLLFLSIKINLLHLFFSV